MRKSPSGPTCCGWEYGRSWRSPEVARKVALGQAASFEPLLLHWAEGSPLASGQPLSLPQKGPCFGKLRVRIWTPLEVNE